MDGWMTVGARKACFAQATLYHLRMILLKDHSSTSISKEILQSEEVVVIVTSKPLLNHPLQKHHADSSAVLFTLIEFNV